MATLLKHNMRKQYPCRKENVNEQQLLNIFIDSDRLYNNHIIKIDSFYKQMAFCDMGYFNKHYLPNTIDN